MRVKNIVRQLVHRSCWRADDPFVPLVTRMGAWAKFFGVPIVELCEELDDMRAKVRVLAAGTQLVQHLCDDLMRPLYTPHEVLFSLESAEPT